MFKFKWKDLGGILENVWLEAAALAYASLFSLIPLVSLTIVLLQSLLPEHTVMPMVESLIADVLGETFDAEIQAQVIDIINRSLNQFYSWKGTLLSTFSILLLGVVGLGLLRRIQRSCYRIFRIPIPPFKMQMLRLGQSFGWMLIILGIICTKILIRHQFEKWWFPNGGLTILQVICIAFLLKSFYPVQTTARASFVTTVIAYGGWKLITWLLTLYASFSVTSRTVLGPWAIMPLFLVWLYSQFVFLFVCLEILRELDRPFQKMKKKKLQAQSKA